MRELSENWKTLWDLLIEVNDEENAKLLSQDKNDLKIIIENMEDLLSRLKYEKHEANWVNFMTPLEALKDINKNCFDYHAETIIKVLDEIAKEPSFDNIVEVIKFDSGFAKERKARYKTLLNFYKNPKIEPELKEELKELIPKHFKEFIIDETDGTDMGYCNPSEGNIKFLKKAIKEVSRT